MSLRDRARLGPDERINFRDVVNIVSGLALGQRFADISPEYPTFSVLVTEANRKQLVGNALRALAGGTRTKDAAAILDALELLDGDRVDPASSRYAQEVLNRLKAKGHGQVLNRSELLSGTSDVEYFAPIKYRLEPDLLVTVLGGLVYSGDIVLSITGDKIDSGKLAQLAERSLEELKQFKHVEAPKEINLAVLRALFELFDLPSGLAQKASQGDTEPVIKLQEKVSALVPRVLKAGSDLQQGKLGFWGQNLLREEEAKDWHARLDSLKKFTESLAPYNTVGKLKNLRVTQEDLDAQKKNLEILAAVERLLELVVELGSTASYLSQAEMVLPAEHPWVKQAETARKALQEKLSQDRTAEHAAEYRKTLNQLKKDYITAYIASHSKARLGVAEDKTRNALRKDDRLLALRVLAGVSLMPTSQLTAFEESLNGLKSCSSLDEPTLVTAAVCPHCQFRPSAEQLELIPAAKDLAEAATTLMEQMDERDRRADQSTRKQITIAVWSVGISAVLALFALIVSGFAYVQDRGSSSSEEQWQVKLLAAIEQGNQQRSATEHENEALREQVNVLGARIAVLEAAQRVAAAKKAEDATPPHAAMDSSAAQQ